MLNKISAFTWTFVGIFGWLTGRMGTDDALFCLAIAALSHLDEIAWQLTILRKERKPC